MQVVKRLSYTFVHFYLYVQKAKTPLKLHLRYLSLFFHSFLTSWRWQHLLLNPCNQYCEGSIRRSITRAVSIIKGKLLVNNILLHVFLLFVDNSKPKLVEQWNICYTLSKRYIFLKLYFEIIIELSRLMSTHIETICVIISSIIN